MKIVHAADIHLDRAFPGQGLGSTGDERRRALVDAFLRIVDFAADADALCICGDLYEHEHVTANTQNFLLDQFERLNRPVLVLPGNHDPYLTGSVYQRTDWPENVHVFSQSTPEPFQLADDIYVWGIAYTQRELDPSVVCNLRIPKQGSRRDLLMLHGSLGGSGSPGADTEFLPMTHAELAATGADFVMLGHYHGGLVDGNVCYPGSPEPLTWAERGRHAVNVLTVDGSGVHAELHDVNRLTFDVIAIDADGCTSSAEIEELVTAQVKGREDPGLGLRIELTGEVDPGCEVDPPTLAERCGGGLLDLVVVDGTVPSYDLDEIAKEPTVRGRFVRSLLERAAAAPEEHSRIKEAMRVGLRAIDGRTDLIGLAPTPEEADAD